MPGGGQPPGVEYGPSDSGPEPPGLHPIGASCQPVPVRRLPTRACRQLLKAGELLRPWAGREQSGYGATGPRSTPASRPERRPRLPCRLLPEAGVRASVPVGRTRAVGLRARALHPAARPERRRRLLVLPSRLLYLSKPELARSGRPVSQLTPRPLVRPAQLLSPTSRRVSASRLLCVPAVVARESVNRPSSRL
nr:uncharacterized protein LOC129387570 [Dermacentor andersoni]